MDLHVEARGAGPVVVLAHGFGGSARNFRPQVRALEANYRMVTYDARGHARSPAPAEAEAYTLAALVDDLAGVVEAAGIDRVVVGGLSLGAAVALHYAAAHPERVAGLALASLPAGRGGAGVSATAEAFADAIDADGLEAAGEQFVWGARSGLDEQAARFVRQGFLEHAPHALAHLLRNVLAPLEPPARVAAQLAEHALPALVVAGGDDAASLPACRAVAEALPGSRLEVVPDAGHVVNLAQPAAVNALLREFLATLA
ncbi:MAG: alpha/beta hydrolase [Proteobacteria bacterium]|nr:alpha/beta hydrolase [Pseudomonadota bacterium]